MFYILPTFFHSDLDRGFSVIDYDFNEELFVFDSVDELKAELKRYFDTIDGPEVDFVKSGLNEAFSFRNPSIKGECGCGESFNV